MAIAVAMPIPELPPVTRAFWPLRSCADFPPFTSALPATRSLLEPTSRRMPAPRRQHHPAARTDGPTRPGRCGSSDHVTLSAQARSPPEPERKIHLYVRRMSDRRLDRTDSESLTWEVVRHGEYRVAGDHREGQGGQRPERER